MKKLYMLLAVVLIMVITGCSSSWDPIPPPSSSVKAITAFSLAGVVGTINETGKTIAVAMPFGTDVTNLVATFTTTGASVNVGSTVQISGTTANNFTSSVTFTVTAVDASTQDYTVTVAVALSSAKAITAFSLAGVVGTINETGKTIAVTMPFGTSVTNLVATFTTTGASVNVDSTVQTSGTTAHNFTSPVTYTVTAADSSTQDYTVTVAVALSSAKAITAFSLAGVVGTMNETGKTIAVTMPFGTSVTNLVATFTTTGASVNVDSTVQTSGTTAHNFTSPVTYTVTAADSSTQDYTVTVAVALSSAKAITAFSLAGVVGTINETGKTIAVTMPFGTDVTNLVATFATTGVSVKVDSTVQISETTANTFTSPVTYTVTAADNTTQDYTVTVTVAPSIVPGAPTIGTATAGNAQATVTFTAPVSDGGSAITGYTVTSSPGGLTGTGTASPIIVTGLTNETAYTFTVTATNAIGTSVASSASNSVTPVSTVTNPTTGKVWMDRNLGATQVATSSTDAAAYGDLYQWGRGTDGHQIRTSGTTSGPTNTDAPGTVDFISASGGMGSTSDWRNPQNDNLWQGVTGTNNPCPSGFRLPTETELLEETASWSSQNTDGAYASPLKFTVAGIRWSIDGSLAFVGTRGSYWSSTVTSPYSRSLYFGSSEVGTGSSHRAQGGSVRCIKN